MTEDEARQKWCPMVRLAYDTVSANRFVNDPRSGMTTPDADCCCIASDCMMFKWDDNYDHGGDSTADRYNTANNRGGYCGLTK